MAFVVPIGSQDRRPCGRHVKIARRHPIPLCGTDHVEEQLDQAGGAWTAEDDAVIRRNPDVGAEELPAGLVAPFGRSRTGGLGCGVVREGRHGIVAAVRRKTMGSDAAARLIDSQAEALADITAPDPGPDPAAFRDAVVAAAIERNGDPTLSPVAGVLFAARWRGGGMVLT